MIYFLNWKRYTYAFHRWKIQDRGIKYNNIIDRTALNIATRRGISFNRTSNRIANNISNKRSLPFWTLFKKSLNFASFRPGWNINLNFWILNKIYETCCYHLIIRIAFFLFLIKMLNFPWQISLGMLNIYLIIF